MNWALSAQPCQSARPMGCVRSTGLQLSAGALCFGVRVAWRWEQYRSPSSCFIFHLITYVNEAERGLGRKSPRKQPGKHWLKTLISTALP